MGEFGLSGYERTGYWQLLQLPANSPLNQAMSIHNCTIKERKKNTTFNFLKNILFNLVFFVCFLNRCKVTQQQKKQKKISH